MTYMTVFSELRSISAASRMIILGGVPRIEPRLLGGKCCAMPPGCFLKWNLLSLVWFFPAQLNQKQIFHPLASWEAVFCNNAEKRHQGLSKGFWDPKNNKVFLDVGCKFVEGVQNWMSIWRRGETKHWRKHSSHSKTRLKRLRKRMTDSDWKYIQGV